MVSAPQSAQIRNTAYQASKIAVLLGDDSGGAPDTEVNWLVPLEIVRTKGAQQEDYATFEYDLGKRGTHIENAQVLLEFSRLVEVRLISRDDPDEYTVIFWGEITVQDERIDRSEQLVVTGRIPPYLFGDLMEGQRQWDDIDSVEYRIGVDVTFNPLIDGVVERNRSSRRDLDDDHYLWLDPESARSPNALNEAQGGVSREEWTLEQATEALLWMLNADEDSIKNPSEFDEELFKDALKPLNVSLERGEYLPSYLDQLLEPRGYGWFIALEVKTDDQTGDKTTEPTIAIYKRDGGDEKTVDLQAFGEDFDLAETNLSELTVQTDIASLVNKATGFGSREQKEITVDLYRGWLETFDSLTADDLRRSDDDSQFETHQDVWRLWVGNEAGDYSGSRTEIPSTPLALSAVVFDVAIPRRRVMEDCLTFDDNDRRRPPYLEWSDDDGSTWYPVPSEWGWTVLKDQIGIYFTGDTPPGELIQAGDDAKLRLTGTVTGDARPSKGAVQNGSANRNDVELYLDLSDRYHKRSRQTSGLFRSVFDVDPDANDADERDDTSDIGDYAEEVVKNEQSAASQTVLHLHGIQVGYEIGDIITEVDGREIDLNLNDPGAQNKKYIQVTGMRLLLQHHITELLVTPVEA